MKVCTKCKKEKSLESFYKHAAMSDGRFHYCKACEKERSRLNQAMKRDKIRGINYITCDKCGRSKHKTYYNNPTTCTPCVNGKDLNFRRTASNKNYKEFLEDRRRRIAEEGERTYVSLDMIYHARMLETLKSKRAIAALKIKTVERVEYAKITATHIGGSDGGVISAGAVINGVYVDFLMKFNDEAEKNILLESLTIAPKEAAQNFLANLKLQQKKKGGQNGN